MSRAIGPFTALLFVYEPVACDAGHSTAKKYPPETVAPISLSHASEN